LRGRITGSASVDEKSLGKAGSGPALQDAGAFLNVPGSKGSLFDRQVVDCAAAAALSLGIFSEMRAMERRTQRIENRCNLARLAGTLAPPTQMRFSPARSRPKTLIRPADLSVGPGYSRAERLGSRLWGSSSQGPPTGSASASVDEKSLAKAGRRPRTPRRWRVSNRSEQKKGPLFNRQVVDCADVAFEGIGSARIRTEG
jgi:hypothetical protein